jgi:hypothetical protein
MKQNRHTVDQIIAKLRRADIELGNLQDVVAHSTVAYDEPLIDNREETKRCTGAGLARRVRFAHQRQLPAP